LNSPQQLTDAVVATPQPKASVDPTDANVPGGGADCPTALLPQQASVWSVRIPQASLLPRSLTAVNVPDGVVATTWPGTSSTPQQASVWSVRIAHESANPALIAVNVPGGAASLPGTS
jgi:hypothetical protein